MAEIEMPQLGETVTEGTITRWFKSIGDAVAVDEVLFEVSTDKVDTEVPSTAAGVLSEIRVPEGETVEVGTVLAVVGDGASAPAAEEPPAAETPPEPEPEPPAAAEPPPPQPSTAPPPPQPSTAPPPPPQPQPQPQQASGVATGAGTAGKVLSPVVRRLINSYGIDADQITGSGLGGRISRDDVQRYIEAHDLEPGG